MNGLLTILMLTLLGAGPESPEPVMTVTVNPSQVVAGDTVIADLVCRVDGMDCSRQELAALDSCWTAQPSELCLKAKLTIPFEFKENLDPNSLVLPKLYKQLMDAWKSRVEQTGDQKKQEGRVLLKVHPFVPFRLLIDVMYTAGRVGVRGGGGIREFLFVTLHDKDAAKRVYRLPEYKDPRRAAPIPPTVLVGSEYIELIIHYGTTAIVNDILNEEDEAPRIPEPKKVKLGKIKARQCPGYPYAVHYDLARLYNQLVALKKEDKFSGVTEIVVGTDGLIPWYLVAQVHDTVTRLRGTESYTDSCELLADESASTPLFPNVFFMML